MTEPCVLGVDLGTGSCKVCVVAADGRVLGVGAAAYPIRTPQGGWSEQDAGEWLPAVARAMAGLWEGLRPRPDIAAIALSSAAHIPVLLDADGAPLRPAILWNDVRSGAEAARLVAEIGETILAQTCNQAGTTWSLPQLLWVREYEPDVWRRVRRICLSKDYLFHLLTGRFVTDAATAVSSLLYDVRGRRWSEGLCARLEISPAILPEVAPVAEPAGTLLSAVADRLGLPHGLPVMPGTLDSVTETYSTGAVLAGDCVIRLGTGGGVQVLRPGPIGHPQLISYPYPIGLLWLSQAATNACGAAVDWVARMLGLPSAEALSALASTAAPGAGGVVFHPYLSGERTPYWNSALRGSFGGLSLAHGPGHLARAALEGIAYSLRDAFSVFEGDAGVPEVSTMTVVGGGAKSAVLVRILCDVFARPIRVHLGADSACGAALLALDRLHGDSPARARADSASALQPDPTTSQLYADRFAEYRRIAARLVNQYGTGR